MVRSPDTDVFLLLLSFSSELDAEIYMDTGVGNNKRILNINVIANDFTLKICNALLGLHAFTDCYTTNNSE